jgi:hypothetical protein
MSPAANDVVETLSSESCTKLRKMSLGDNTVRRIWNVSKCPCDQLTNFKPRVFHCKHNETTDVIKDAHVLENDTNGFFFLFCFVNLLMVELRHWKCSV